MATTNLISQLEKLSLDVPDRSKMLGYLRRLKINKGFWSVGGGTEGIIFDENSQKIPAILKRIEINDGTTLLICKECTF